MNLAQNMKASFGRVKKDIEGLKHNSTEWIVFLSGKQRETDARLRQLEERAAFLERKLLEGYDYGRER